jgi:hypothetical protein
MRIYIIIAMLFTLIYGCVPKPTSNIQCDGFKFEYINNDTLRFKTDLKYTNSIGDTSIYKFKIFNPDEDYDCTNSFVNHCYCDSKLEIIYANEITEDELTYLFYYSGDSKSIHSAIYKFKGIMYFFDKEYNGINYESIINIEDSLIFENKKIKKIYIDEGHFDRFVDDSNVVWKRIK